MNAEERSVNKVNIEFQLIKSLGKTHFTDGSTQNLTLNRSDRVLVCLGMEGLLHFDLLQSHTSIFILLASTQPIKWQNNNHFTYFLLSVAKRQTGSKHSPVTRQQYQEILPSDSKLSKLQTNSINNYRKVLHLTKKKHHS